MSSSSQGSFSPWPLPYVGVCTGSAAEEGVALPLDGTFGVGVSIEIIGLGVAVGVSHGVLE